MTRGIKWADWKLTDIAETLKMLHDAHKIYFVAGIQENKIPTSETEDTMPVHIIPDEGESVRLNEKLEKSLEFTYPRTEQP